MSATQSTTVCFIGLGAMGYPMAGHLVRKGCRVMVHNRTPGKSQRWAKEHGAQWAATPAQAAQGASVVLCCVGNDEDLREAALGPQGAFAAMGPDAVFVDHTTTSAQIARALYASARERGIHFVDAPVTGGEPGAQAGTLTIMCGGDAAPFARAEPVMAAYARAIHRVGDSGSGQLAKMVNQLCVAGVLQGLAEGLHFGERAGLDMVRVLEVIGSGAAQSWQMHNRGRTMIEGRFDFGFAVEWMRKDLGICLGEARRNGASLPLAALVDQLYAEVEAMGGARWDFSSLVARLRRGKA